MGTFKSLARYFMDNASPGLREFVERATEAGIAPLKTFKKFKQIAEGCWESPNGVLLLFTKGIKVAVEKYQNTILSFLQ